MTWPTGTAPSTYTTVDWRDTGPRNGIFYVGETVLLSLDKAGANAYEVRNYLGTIVDSGAVSGTSINLGSSWNCGWYRVYLTGPVSDPDYGYSYGATNFVVFRDTAGFADNPPKTTGYSGGNSEEFPDTIMHGICGIGYCRKSITDLTDLYYSNGIDAAVYETTTAVSYWTDDPVRQPLEQVCTFPSAVGIPDRLDVLDVSSNYSLYVYLIDDTRSGDDVFITGAAGSVSGGKITVSYPNAGTVVETFDNLATSITAQATINAASNYIRVFHDSGSTNWSFGPTAIGTAKRDGMIEVVSTLFPLGCQWFEGPSNEPTMRGIYAVELEHKMKLSRAYVRAGHPDAKFIGPAALDINDLDAWDQYLATGAADDAHCDGISTHAYNAMTNGDINLGRTRIQEWIDLLASYGLEDKPLWITESTHTFCSVYGVYHPRRSRVPLLTTLLFEQYGIPRGRNLVWYDNSHGFWSYPAFSVMGDQSLNPYPALYRTLAEETYGKLHHHAIDFGSVQANAIWLGSVYGDGVTTASVAVVQMASHMDAASVTFTVIGTTDALTYVDSWGNESTVNQTSGRVTVSTGDTPVYLRLPAGVHVRVYSVNDWGPTPPQTISPRSIPTIGSTNAPLIANNGYSTSYEDRGGTFYDTAALPQTASLLFSELVDVNRVIVWCGTAWQSSSALLAFTIQTTTDGSNWTTRKTVSRSASSFQHVTNAAGGTGCTRETYWDEQWILDETLPATYSCTGVRVNVTATSYGGEPDAAAVASGGQGDTDQHVVIQEISVPSTSTPPSSVDDYATEVLADSPIVYLRFSEASGTLCASEVNTPTLNATITNYSGSAANRVEGAIADSTLAYNNGQSGGNYVFVPNNALLNVGDTFTIEFWMRGINLNGFTYLVNTNGQVYANLGVLYFSANFNSNPICHSSITLDGGNWHHIAITKSGSTSKMYVDSVDVTVADTNHTLTDTGYGLYCAAQSVSAAYVGSFDEFALYGTALSKARIVNHYLASTKVYGVPASTNYPMVYA
jgi:hypothetical protein